MRRIVSLILSLSLVMPGLALAAKITEKMDSASIHERTQPFGDVEVVGGVAAPTVAPVKLTAKGVYNKHCNTCHNAGVAGAPVLGNKKAWSARIAQGLPVLHKHAIEGIRAMPAMGTCGECTEDDIKMTVDWMVNQSK